MAKKDSYKILLVEDNPDHVELIMEALQNGGLRNQIAVVHDGVEALDYIYGQGKYSDQNPPIPDFMLLDIRLPKKDGFEVLREVKKDFRLKSIPIILLTSSADECEIEKGYQCGANSFVIKPLNFKELTEKIRNIQMYWMWTNTLPPAGYHAFQD